MELLGRQQEHEENGPLVIGRLPGSSQVGINVISIRIRINQAQLFPQNNNIKIGPARSDPDQAGVAIRFQQARFSYTKKLPVLVDLDVTVPTGSIYGLLGPSGCGKTTLLQCIVGKRRLKTGTVTLFGGKPGVPGPRVGYMPQELALYNEFTMQETLRYFGYIFGMSSRQIEERTLFLMDFLDLPRSKRRLIREMSGGQQRRISLAAALLHQPSLLILDEPTVGVDPLLRQCIWNHLLEISRGRQQVCTIVITTHYIEEARQAHRQAKRIRRISDHNSVGSLYIIMHSVQCQCI